MLSRGGLVFHLLSLAAALPAALDAGASPALATVLAPAAEPVRLAAGPTPMATALEQVSGAIFVVTMAARRERVGTGAMRASSSCPPVPARTRYCG